MTIESHVTSLELSNQLKGLRVPQESQFSWRQQCIGLTEVAGIVRYGEPIIEHLHPCVEKSNCCIAAAYLASEIGAWLPGRIDRPRIGQALYLSIQKCDNGLFIGAYLTPIVGLLPSKESDPATMPETLGLLLKWCMEEGYVKAEDLRLPQTKQASPLPEPKE